MTYLQTLMRAAALGLCVVAFSGTALADPGNGNGAPPATPPGQEKKAEPAPAPVVAPAPAPQTAAPGQAKKAENQAAKAEKSAANPDKAAKPAKAAKPEKAAKPAKTSGSYKNTSSGTDLKKGVVGGHKHTICHATGSGSNPFVRITPSVSGVFHGHIGHQGDEDIIPPFVYKGTTYSQNWDAEGQALFTANCAAPATSQPLTPVAPTKTEDKKESGCLATTTTAERVLDGAWHATGAYKNGQRKFVFITPSLGSAHYDKSKHADDVPVYENRTVTTTGSADTCKSALATPSGPPASLTQPQPVIPVAAGTTPAAGAVGVLPAATASQPVGGVLGAVSPTNAAAKQDKPAGGVLGAIASAPAAVAETATTGTLPFTGIPLWIAALIGGALLAAGLVLRRTA